MANILLKPRYQIINGVRCSESFSPSCFKEAMDYKPRPDDVFIMTYPKCGTTWMQIVALHVFHKGKEITDLKDEFFKLCPFIDAFGLQGINSMPRPGAFKTHLPYNRMPYSPQAKYIIVLRNPKDCCVSLYYHTKFIVSYGYWDGKFDDFFELFMAGEVEYDDYFDHLMSWYPHRNDSQVFFTTYENMKRDTKGVVLKLASFLGREYIEAIEKDNNVLNNIVHFTGFDYMKKHLSDVYGSSLINKCANDPFVFEGVKYMAQYAKLLNPPSDVKLEFIRKGVIGDWRHHLSDEQSERLNNKLIERTQGTDVVEMYKEFM